MASSYPSGLDAFSTSHQDNAGEVIHAQSINDNSDAINKIEAELGTNPRGSSSSVAGRLTRHNALVTATSTSYTPDASTGAVFKISFATAPTINAPTNGNSGQRIYLDLNNTSAGALTPTLNAVFKTQAVMPAIGAGKRRVFTFYYDGTNWVEITRSTADI